MSGDGRKGGSTHCGPNMPPPSISASSAESAFRGHQTAALKALMLSRFTGTTPRGAPPSDVRRQPSGERLSLYGSMKHCSNTPLASFL